MSKKLRIDGDDVRGVNRLVIEGILGVVDLVEAMHCNIAGSPGLRAKSRQPRTRGITGLVYRSIRGVTGLTGQGLDALLARVAPLLGERSNSARREALLAALNGVLGDHLAASGNPLAITMRLRQGGLPLPDGRAALRTALPQATGRLVVLVHGLCMNDLQWTRKGHDHGAALARDCTFTSVYLHYNSGLHISTNGRAFADLLEDLVRRWPVPLTELVLIGHSMGGLVARSACDHAAQMRHQWLQRLDKLVFVGTPHHGAPLERGGNWIDTLLGSNAYSAPLARLGKIRSAGITDLRFGNLVDADWNERDRFERSGDRRVPVPLPEGVACYAIAATTGKVAGALGDRLIGDGIVPLASALGRHANQRLALTFDPSRQWVIRDTGHLDLLSRPEVYAQIRRWMEIPAQGSGSRVTAMRARGQDRASTR
ncbi:MAG TPA: alpha/beta fold hydrolase [Casimicrobiaceae bacterium]|nr:alpha/beta fold hydrolase [Casimicrobiaceae bacterium]